jgi:hypothetical protein
MSLSYKVDSGSWTACGSNLGNSTNGTLVRWGTALSAGSHTVYVKASDGSLESSTTSRAFTYAVPT